MVRTAASTQHVDLRKRVPQRSKLRAQFDRVSLVELFGFEARPDAMQVAQVTSQARAETQARGSEGIVDGRELLLFQILDQDVVERFVAGRGQLETPGRELSSSTRQWGSLLSRPTCTEVLAKMGVRATVRR